MIKALRGLFEIKLARWKLQWRRRLRAVAAAVRDAPGKLAGPKG